MLYLILFKKGIKTREKGGVLQKIMQKVIASVIDDVLNNFSETLNHSGILFDSRIHSVTNPLLKKCLYNYKDGFPTEPARNAMNSTVSEQAAAFLRSLSEQGWEIALCTNRDLRFAFGTTQTWLSDQKIPCDYLVQTADPVGFCRKAGIHFLISDRPSDFFSDLAVFYCPVQYLQNLWRRCSCDFEDVRKCLPK